MVRETISAAKSVIVALSRLSAPNIIILPSTAAMKCMATAATRVHNAQFLGRIGFYGLIFFGIADELAKIARLG